ncbi:MAG: hypothetical protein H6600_00830 [Flavobacteriales bacterium]|nr:hypothetical protein [Flavobacteriales bacterium]
MFIEFPCPVKFENLSTTANGHFCSSCNKEVIDLDKFPFTENLKELVDNNACVSSSERLEIHTGFSIRKFALGLLLVFGSSLFVISEAQLADSLNELKGALLNDSINNRLDVRIVNQQEIELYVGVEVYVILPNGQKLNPNLNNGDQIIFSIPDYSINKEIYVVAIRRGVKKSKRIVYNENTNSDIITFRFHTRKVKRPRIGRIGGCPNF